MSSGELDPRHSKVIAMIKNDSDFPDTDQISVMAKYLYRKLDHEMTLAFQQTLMFWKFFANGNKQPEDPRVLDEINEIVSLQNNDPEYRFRISYLLNP